MRSFARFVILAALILGLAAPLTPLLGAAGTRFGLFDWKIGFGLLTVAVAPVVAMVGAALGLVSLLFALFGGRRELLVLALIGFVAPAATLGAFWTVKTRAQALPPIHDVATDWSDPIMFTKSLMNERAGALNAVEADPRLPAEPRLGKWAGRRVAEVNAETCPGARPVNRMVSEEEAVAALERAGVQVIGRAPFRVEGTATSFWFGFQDDVAVRIRPGRTDVRSVSRVGFSDIGANCARVTRIVQSLIR